MRSDDTAHREDYQRHEAVRRERDLLRDLLTEASRQARRRARMVSADASSTRPQAAV
jgi:hypothetical protein